MKVQAIKSKQLETKKDNKLDISQCFNFCSYNGITYDILETHFKTGNIIVLIVAVEDQKTTITITESKETFDMLLALYMKRISK
jgi:hypothetical protein